VRLAAGGPAAAVMLVSLGLLAVGASASAAPDRPPALAKVVIPNLGAGYAVVSQGPLDAGQFATSSPDPSAASAALHTLSGSITTYQRVWQDGGRNNEVQDLVVRFSTVSGARSFLGAAQRSLTSGEIVSSVTLPAIPGAHRTTYFATTTQVGVGQAITMRSSDYVALLSFFSSNAASNTEPISPADAQTIALAQHDALLKALRQAARPVVPPAGRSSSPWGWAALSVAAIVLVLLVTVVWRYRRAQSATPPTTDLTAEEG
jgi:hypothetical protein